jgi:glutathione S-transferase
LDRTLADSEYIAGDFFSVADISAMVAIDFASWIKMFVPDNASHVARWYAAVSTRSSASA